MPGGVAGVPPKREVPYADKSMIYFVFASKMLA